MFLARGTGSAKGLREAVSGAARGLVWQEQKALVDCFPSFCKEIEAFCFYCWLGF